MITAVARHLHTSIDAVEEWDIDKLLAYRASLSRLLKAERPRPKG